MHCHVQTHKIQASTGPRPSSQASQKSATAAAHQDSEAEGAKPQSAWLRNTGTFNFEFLRARLSILSRNEEDSQKMHVSSNRRRQAITAQDVEWTDL